MGFLSPVPLFSSGVWVISRVSSSFPLLSPYGGRECVLVYMRELETREITHTLACKPRHTPFPQRGIEVGVWASPYGGVGVWASPVGGVSVWASPVRGVGKGTYTLCRTLFPHSTHTCLLPLWCHPKGARGTCGLAFPAKMDARWWPPKGQRVSVGKGGRGWKRDPPGHPCIAYANSVGTHRDAPKGQRKKGIRVMHGRQTQAPLCILRRDA